MTSSALLLSQPSFFVCIIISFRPAWLARALLSFKRAQSSGNDDVDERHNNTLSVINSVCVCNSPVSLLSLTSVKDGYS